MAKRVLIVATVVKKHIMQFHIPTIRMLGDMGWEIDVAARNDYAAPEDLCIPGISQYYDIPFGRNPLSISNITAYKTLKKIIDEGNYDVVHCHTPVGGILTRLAARKARKLGTKVFYTAHGFHFFKGAPIQNWLLYYPAELICSVWTDVLITICKEDYDLAKRKLHPKQIAYTPGIGIKEELFAKRPKKDQKSDSKEKILLSVGELVSNKNHESVIRALKQINDTNIIYWIAGDGELKDELSVLIRQADMDDRVVLLGYQKNIAELYAKADLFIHPSFREGLPVAVMEAMASDLPVVASDVRGNRELLSKKVLFNPKDTGEIASKIEEYIYHPDEEEIQKNRDTIKQYSQDKVLQILRKIYTDI